MQQDSSFKLDPRYKKYVLAVEKSLQTFEAIDEWADIISFLSKFCKVNIPTNAWRFYALYIPLFNVFFTNLALIDPSVFSVFS